MGVTGSDPGGARARFRDGKDTLCRIRGTEKPRSFGEAVSAGCNRLRDQEVPDPCRRVPDGAKGSVLPG